MPTVQRYIRARHVATMTAAGVIDDGCLVLTGDRIATVGPFRDIHPPRVDEMFDGLLTPGLVNAHTHLELSDRVAGQPPTDGFAGWLVGMLQRSSTKTGELEKLVARGTAIGIEQCLRFGVTTVGDISRQCHWTRPLLAASPLRAVSFGEVQAMGQNRGLLDARVAAAVAPTQRTGRLEIGITPHAPYSVEPDGYRLCLETARRRGLPLATHLAESPDEAAFLADHSGPLRGLWDWIGRFDDAVPTFSGGPIAFAQAVGLLAYPSLLAHVNYATDADLARLAAGRAAVVWCPRTHAYFGHPPHRWREMRAAGIAVCIGTDSCASSPDLNLMDDLRLVRRQSPEVPAAELWTLVTSAAADALRWQATAGRPVGRLEAGAMGDVVAWPTRTGDPLGEVLDTTTMRPEAVRIGGVVPFPGHTGRGKAGRVLGDR